MLKIVLKLKTTLHRAASDSELLGQSDLISNIRWVPYFGFLVAAIWLGLSFSGLFRPFETGSILASKFTFREWLNRSPQLHPQLKILALDDSTVAAMERPDLSDQEWLLILRTIAANAPAVIAIDKVFSNFDPLKHPDDLSALQRFGIPVIAGSYLSDSENRFRKSITFEPSIDLLPEKHTFQKTWKYHYGPSAQANEAKIFTTVGHLNGLRSGSVNLLQAGPNGAVVPHISLIAQAHAQTINGAGNAPLQEQLELFRADDFAKLPNFPNLEKLTKNTVSLNGIYARALRNISISSIQKGDVVLILPEMYTGNTDFSDTPIGRIPGGYVLAAILNDFLNQSHIVSWHLQWWHFIFLFVFYLLIHRAQSAASATLYGLMAVSLWVTAAFLAFTYLSLDIPILGVTGFATISMFSASIGSKAFLNRILYIARALEQEHARVERHLKEAAAMATILPNTNKVTACGYEVTSFHDLFEYASGDWYSVELSPSARYIHILLADVTGHGLQAALVVSSCKTVLSFMLEQTDQNALESSDFIEKYANSLNRILVRNGNGTQTTTLTAVTIDTQLGQISYLIAANPSIIMTPAAPTKKNQSLRQLNNPLGTDGSARFSVSTSPIELGQIAVIATDGFALPGRKIAGVAMKIGFDSIAAKSLADELIKLSPEGVRDDLTLICVRRTA